MAAKISLPIMEEKRPIRSRPLRRIRPLVIIALTFFTLYFLGPVGKLPSFFSIWTPSSANTPAAKSPATKSVVEVQKVADGRRLVPLEAHIMSKCPDAKDCLKDLILPTMMKVNDKVNFTLSYIGTPTENDGVECMHGPNECMGNILELCAAKLYPDPKIYLGFVMCLTRDYKDIPQRDLIEDCALEHAIDFDNLNNCAAQDDGAFGMELLRKSVERTAKVGWDQAANTSFPAYMQVLT